MWEVVEEKTKEHWLEVKDPEGWYYAIVRFDGCIHFNRCYNEPESFNDSMTNYLHICDIDEIINRLQELKKAALKHFGENWPA